MLDSDAWQPANTYIFFQCYSVLSDYLDKFYFNAQTILFLKLLRMDLIKFNKLYNALQ